MPYIDQNTREVLRNQDRGPETSGELNYMITLILDEYIRTNGVRYQFLNDCIGALEGAKLELYRRIVAPYENMKARQNGDVYTVEG